MIRAPFGGQVLTRHLDVGATVNDGVAVYDIADLRPLYADVQVPERQVARLEPGQTVRLMTDDDESSGTAEIERIAVKSAGLRGVRFAKLTRASSLES